MNDRIRALLKLYDAGIVANGISSIRRWANPLSKRERLQHLRWMIDIMLAEAAGAGGDVWSVAKINCWLGFIQGTLQTEGMISIGMLRDQSRDLYGEDE